MHSHWVVKEKGGKPGWRNSNDKTSDLEAGDVEQVEGSRPFHLCHRLVTVDSLWGAGRGVGPGGEAGGEGGPEGGEGEARREGGRREEVERRGAPNPPPPRGTMGFGKLGIHDGEKKLKLFETGGGNGNDNDG